MNTIKVIDIIGTNSAISPRTGLKAYEFVASEINQQHTLNLTFEGVTELTSAFCNFFIGKLYMNFGQPLIDSMVHINGIEESNIWFKKIQEAIYLGTNEQARNLHKSNLRKILES